MIFYCRECGGKLQERILPTTTTAVCQLFCLHCRNVYCLTTKITIQQPIYQDRYTSVSNTGEIIEIS